MTFLAVEITQTVEKGRVLDHRAQLRKFPESRLAASGGDHPVTIAVTHSGINFKDGLAIAGRPGVARTSPLIPGVDLVGVVTASEDARWQPDTRVLLNGDGLGESRDGGLATLARVRGDRMIAVPESLSNEQAAAIGTAGFTAMLSVLALERGGVTPDAGDVVVTGAAGGVGSVAIAVLARLGYRVVASSGRAGTEGDYLRRLGAVDVIDRGPLGAPGRPLQERRWAGAVDSVGSVTLANLLAQTRDGGVVTACGLAQGADLPTTVMPFILRGVTLAGINSVEASLPLRHDAWSRLASDLDLELLAEMTTVIPLADVFDRSEQILSGRVRGRTVVDTQA